MQKETIMQYDKIILSEMHKKTLLKTPSKGLKQRNVKSYNIYGSTDEKQWTKIM